MADENADVSLTGDPGKQAPSGDDADKGKGKEKDDLATLRAENETLRKTNQTLADSERYWADRAKVNGKGDVDDDDEDETPKPKKAKPAADDDDEADEDPAKFVDDLSASGIKALQKRGLLTKKQAEKMMEDIAEKVAEKVSKRVVGQARSSMTQDAELARDYPDLKDTESEHFKETSKIYQDMIKRDPKLKESPAALLMAAQNAKLKLQIKNGGTDDDKEQKRQQRIREQGGERGRRGSADFDDDDDDRMSPEMKSIAASLGVKDSEYIAAKKQLRAR